MRSYKQQAKHKKQHKALNKWIKGVNSFLRKPVKAKSSKTVRSAIKTQISYAKVHPKKMKLLQDLVAIGETVKTAAYTTEISQWQFEQPERLDQMELEVRTGLEAIPAALTDKRTHLDVAFAQACQYEQNKAMQKKMKHENDDLDCTIM